MRMKQAAAAVGQCENMFLYDKFFGYFDKTVGQILLNAEDITQEEKKENLSNTFEALLEKNIIPIVNENDSVSYTEIESEEKLFSDNDVLSAVVAILCKADLLVILSDIDGFYKGEVSFDGIRVPLIAVKDYETGRYVFDLKVVECDEIRWDRFRFPPMTFETFDDRTVATVKGGTDLEYYRVWFQYYRDIETITFRPIPIETE